MRLPDKLNDGSFLRETVILALVESGVKVGKYGDGETYELVSPNDDIEVVVLPPVVGYRMVQYLMEKFGLVFGYLLALPANSQVN